MKLRSSYSLNPDWQCSQRILPQIIINTCEGEGIVHIKTDCSEKMLVAFTIKEKKLFIGKPIFRYGAAAFLFMFVVLSS